VNITTIEARDLSEAFFLCNREILKKGNIYTIDKGSFEGTRRLEFDFVTVQIKQPSTKPLAPDIPDGIPSPCTDKEIEHYHSEELLRNCLEANEIYTYGQYLVPQLTEVLLRYDRDGHECNQLTMNIGDVGSIYQEHPPCLRVVDTRIKEGKLNFFVYFRSWDLWGGFPVNLGGLQLLKESMAKAIGVDDGELIATSKGLHLYEYAWDWAREL